MAPLCELTYIEFVMKHERQYNVRIKICAKRRLPNSNDMDLFMSEICSKFRRVTPAAAEAA